MRGACVDPVRVHNYFKHIIINESVLITCHIRDDITFQLHE